MLLQTIPTKQLGGLKKSAIFISMISKNVIHVTKGCADLLKLRQISTVKFLRVFQTYQFRLQQQQFQLPVPAQPLLQPQPQSLPQAPPQPQVLPQLLPQLQLIQDTQHLTVSKWQRKINNNDLLTVISFFPKMYFYVKAKIYLRVSYL